MVQRPQEPCMESAGRTMKNREDDFLDQNVLLLTLKSVNRVQRCIVIIKMDVRICQVVSQRFSFHIYNLS